VPRRRDRVPRSSVGDRNRNDRHLSSPWGGVHDHAGGYQWLSDDTIYEGLFIASGRLKLAFARATTTVLEAGQRYLGGVITLDPARPPLPAIDAPPVLAARHGSQAAPQGESAPADLPCAGCGLPACIVLNQVELYQEVGSPGGDIIVLKFPIDHGFVTWQGGGHRRAGRSAFLARETRDLGRDQGDLPLIRCAR
jgi:hypothetical protein